MVSLPSSTAVLTPNRAVKSAEPGPVENQLPTAQIQTGAAARWPAVSGPEIPASQPGALYGCLREFLRDHFALSPQRVSELRLLARPGHLAGRAVLYVKVIDPGAIDTATLDTLEFDSFSRRNLPERALHFEGRIEPDGKILLVPSPWLGFPPIKPVVGVA